MENHEGWCFDQNQASNNIKTGFENSEGWNVKGPMVNQLMAPRDSKPMNQVIISKPKVMKYASFIYEERAR